MESEHWDQVRDIPKMLVMVATVAAMAGCVALGVTVHVAWFAVAVTVLCVGVSLAPKYRQGHPLRWELPGSVVQAIGLGAVPTAVAWALVSGCWWWLAAGVLVLVLAALVFSELDKPKANR